MRWLSKGNVLNRFVGLIDEIAVFFATQTSEKASRFSEKLRTSEWKWKAAYLRDIFLRLNTVNTSLQGSSTTIIDFTDEFRAFIIKLEMWNLKLARNPFKLNVADIDSDMQEELLDLNDSGAHDRFEDCVLSKFWCSLITSYPKLSEVALKVLLIFPSSYKSEQEFSLLLYMKSKYRSRLNVDDDLRVSLTVTDLNIKQITDAKQAQPSH
ncbi:zinc finger BED domain-containing protein 5-like [Watersipora subatra]|uniref:zinc finger BED domain-containing protein 5-like n=1 Tax=Watersipora subatra TaxID=2589382 RepID=UPI00355AE26D